MNKTILLKSTFIILMFFLIQPGLTQSGHNLKISNETKVSVFSVIKKSIIERDKNLYSKENLISIGIDINSLALDYETFSAILAGQSTYVKDYKVEINEHRILLSEDSNEASYFVKYGLSFFVEPFNFHIDEVWESGNIKRYSGNWTITQQHTSVPITNDIWPAYLSKNYIITDPLYKFSKNELLEDFDLLTLALEQSHGRLYNFNPRNIFENLIEEKKNKIKAPMAELEFFNLISPIISSIKCGHTNISLSTQTNNYLSNQKIYFPFPLKFINGKAFVLNNYGNTNIETGSEIVSINNIKMNNIVIKIFEMIGSDGGIITAKYKKLEDKFHEFYGKYLDQCNEFIIEYLPINDASIKVAKVYAILNNTWWKKFHNSQSKHKKLLSLIIMEEQKTAILEIRKFVSREIDELYGSFQQYCDSTFKILNDKSINHLIIDLRENGGGDIAHQLLAYLFDFPVKYLKMVDTPNTRYSFLEYTDKGIFFNTVHPRLWQKHKNSFGRYELLGSSNFTIEPSQHVFNGNLYVLINGNSFSGASNISAILKDQNRAVFFGEETGGCRYGSNSSDYIKLTLPNTQIVVTIPIRNGINNISDSKDLKKGVVPENKTTNTIMDFINGTDSELDYIINYISEK